MQSRGDLGQEGRSREDPIPLGKVPLGTDWLRLLTCVVEVVTGDARFKTPFSGQCRKMA